MGTDKTGMIVVNIDSTIQRPDVAEVETIMRRAWGLSGDIPGDRLARLNVLVTTRMSVVRAVYKARVVKLGHGFPTSRPFSLEPDLKYATLIGSQVPRSAGIMFSNARIGWVQYPISYLEEMLAEAEKTPLSLGQNSVTLLPDAGLRVRLAPGASIQIAPPGQGLH